MSTENERSITAPHAPPWHAGALPAAVRGGARRCAAVRGGGIHAPHTGIRRRWRAHATGPPPYTFAGSQPSLRAFGTTVHNALIAGTKIPLLV
ncbi:hypothetical protein AB1484_32230 [Parafrankia sp. FMc6]|uniref:hypothetical protein n=1 Tax=Parafrankia soli TaxID=2599596 RepID=UPI0034D4A96E